MMCNAFIFVSYILFAFLICVLTGSFSTFTRYQAVGDTLWQLHLMENFMGGDGIR